MRLTSEREIRSPSDSTSWSTRRVETLDTALPGAALGRGEVDVIPSWLDMTVADRRDADFSIRTIPLDIDVYTTGLLAADRLPLELVTRVRDTFVDGHLLQREEPGLGIAAFRRRFLDVSEEHVRASWDLFEPYAFDGVAPGSNGRRSLEGDDRLHRCYAWPVRGIGGANVSSRVPTSGGGRSTRWSTAHLPGP